MYPRRRGAEERLWWEEKQKNGTELRNSISFPVDANSFTSIGMR